MAYLPGLSLGLCLIALLALSRPSAAKDSLSAKDSLVKASLSSQLPEQGGYFDVSCWLLWTNHTFAGVVGSKYCCSFQNPSTTLPIVNYQFVTRRFRPVYWVTGARSDITPLGAVDGYVAPSQSKTFCFINTASAGRPQFRAEYPPFQNSTVAVVDTPGVGGLSLDCSAPPTYEKADRVALAKFTCTLQNLLPVNVSGATFSCDGFRAIRTDNFNADCSWQGTLAPASSPGNSTTFSFWVIAPAAVTISLASVVPPPAVPPPSPPPPSPPPPPFSCVVDVAELGDQGDFSNTCSTIIDYYCNSTTPALREEPIVVNAVVLRLPEVNTSRCVLVSTIPTSSEDVYDTVAFLRSPWSEPFSWLSCNDDGVGSLGSNLYVRQDASVLYEVFIYGFSGGVGSFPVTINEANDTSCDY